MAAPNHKGPPLLPSESGNRVVGPRLPKFGEVMTSAYSSTTTTSTTSTSYSSSSNPIPSRRHPSPLVSRTVPTTPQLAAAKRPQTPDRRRPNTPSPAPSTAVKRPDTPERRWPKTPSPAPSAVVVKWPPSKERRRPSTPGYSGERSPAAKLLGSLSRRSLSFSFQGDSLSLPVSKTKPAPASQGGSVWKATPERRRAPENSKSIDQRRWASSREVNSLTRSNSELKQSVMEDGFTAGFDPIASDTESVYSERSGYEQERRSVATYLQETTSKPKNNEANALAPLKINARNKLSIDSPLSTPHAVSSSSKGTFFSPFRPASPSRRSVTSSASSTPRGTPSPSRVRSGAINDYLSNGWSILSFGDEAARRGGRVGENRIGDAHVLRLMCNRHLQWRFFNARADVEIAYKKITREKSLYNAWVATLKLQRSVASKRAEIQLLQRSLKLYTILKGQMVYLNDWGLIDEDNSSSLSGAAKALESSTLRLPVVGGARANIQNVKDAIRSAVDVMQAMASSIVSLLPKVDKVNSLVSDLARVTSLERAFLEQCEDLLSMLTAVQVWHCSMRTHIIQLSSEGSSLRTEVQQADFIDR
ncbi:QWRF motif-containing protein 2-like isoform X2 [Rhododendron vialii]|uniref:QWRF motif-containing protein 2-like isoform X2 n=1 Tax=Rhododendron vialii TaxID=182163 RepID=UPI00265FD2BC|nr:QWRF motif-containing protein 2-like isoform X2 [Rhododendron vialii]